MADLGKGFLPPPQTSSNSRSLCYSGGDPEGSTAKFPSADLSVSPICGQIQPADPTAMPIDAAEAVLIPLEEEVKKAAEKLDADFSKIKTKIHRFPARLRCLSEDGRYIVPSVVAIGPYHRHLPQLQQTEVKTAAAHNFCRDSGNSVEEVYKKILSVSGDARSCYDDGDEAVAARMNDAEFAFMMFRDGCFLLQFIIFDTDGDVVPSLQSWFLSNQAGLLRDIFLLENQLPWLVFDALVAFSSVPVPVGQFIANMGASFDVRMNFGKKPLVFDYARYNYKPPHLLGLLRFYQSVSMTGEGVPDDLPQGITSVSQSSSAVELAEIGIKLVTSSKTIRFKDMGIKKSGPLYGKLFVAPLVMDDLNACYLVNMVALEECTPDDASIVIVTVISYIYLLAMLMNRVEDVHELRVKSILHGYFTDQQTLDFIKSLVKPLSIPSSHIVLLAQLEAYKRERRVRIAVHKFVYNNIKTIVTVLSVIGVLAGIFKTVPSLKQHQQ